MPLLDREGIEIEDTYLLVEDADDLPPWGDIILPPSRLPSTHTGRVGLRLESSEAVEPLSNTISTVGLVVLHFPSFADGRAYSQARLLRHQLGFEGELRATGDLLPDQFPFMLEAGFDTFDVPDGRFPPERWQEAAQAMSFTYHRHLSRAGQSAILTARHEA